MRRKLTEKTSQLEDRAYAAKRKMDNVIRVEAHKQILSEMAAIKESLGRQSIRLRRARSEPERDLALEQTAQLVNEIVLRFSSSRNDSDAGTPEVWTPTLDSMGTDATALHRACGRSRSRSHDADMTSMPQTTPLPATPPDTSAASTVG